MIKNTTISSNLYFKNSLVVTYQTKIEIELVNITSNVKSITYPLSIFTIAKGSLQFKSYNEIFNNTVAICMDGLVQVQENTVLNISFNTFKYAVFRLPDYEFPHIKPCPIQYISKKGNLDEEFQRGDKLNYSIIFKDNDMISLSNNDMTHCSWDSPSAFSTTRPALVNKRFVAYNHSEDAYNLIVCLSHKHKPKNCQSEEFGPSYPGQTILLDFILAYNSTKEVIVDATGQSDIECEHEKDKPGIYIIQYNKYKTVTYKVKYNYRGWCEISLKIEIRPSLIGYDQETQLYTILIQPCPKGFSLHLDGYCQCDTILSSHIPSLTHCNIDDQTIPRPANSWISAHTVNNSHSYQVSLHCPFDYCLPHSSHLNLSTPDSQCQFNRSGLLCGQCQQGLSAVFGSSQCKQCSNVYLLIIIPIGIAGLVLVLLLFVLNLTVTDGNISGFIFSVNIIYINTSSILLQKNSVMYTFIMLANLDLGVTVCFYNGMDDYTKQWLQLLCPAYLILIVTSVIIASRYSTRIQ